MFGRAAKKAAHILITIGARHKNAIAFRKADTFRRFGDAADGFVTGNKRISEAGERGHFAGPEQFLCAGADSAPLDIDLNRIGTAGRECDSAKSQISRPFQDDGLGFHLFPPDRMRPDEASRDCLNCHFTMTQLNVNRT